MDWTNILAVIAILGFLGTTVNVVYSTRANRKKLSEDHDNNVKARILMEERVKTHDAELERTNKRLDRLEEDKHLSQIEKTESDAQMTQIVEFMRRVESAVQEMKVDLKEHIKEHEKK